MKQSPAYASVLKLSILTLVLFLVRQPLSLAASRQYQDSTSGRIPIPEIQGDGLVSPYFRERVDTFGIVTAITSNGFYLQDPAGDNNIATSDALFVYTRTTPRLRLVAVLR